MRKVRHLLFLLTLSLCSGALFGQAQTNLDIALRHLEANQTDWGLDKADMEDLKISDHVFSKFGKVDHYYFTQRHKGIEVFNAITGVHVNQEGKVASLRHNFVPQLASKVNTTNSRIDEIEALKQVFQNLEMPTSNFNFTPTSRAEGLTTFGKGNVSNVDITVRPIYQIMDAEVRLAWDVTLDPTGNPDYWNIRVDAVNGKVLDKANYTLYCKFHKDTEASTHSPTCKDHDHDTPLVKTTTSESEASTTVAMGGTYNVFAELVDGFLSPFESPIHGDRTLITDPADPVASPFGWHDTNGNNEVDFEITRGNNVYAFLDVDNNDAPDPGSDNLVQGGPELVFDYPWTDQSGGPEDFEAAALTNTFFMSNFVHDFAYAYGFDERSGNFQQNQNGNADSGGNDPLAAHVQDGRDLFFADQVNNAGFSNNANMSTPPDGFTPVMQMYIWNRGGGRLLEVNSPSNISGSYETGTADFGPTATDAPVENAQVVLAFDETPGSESFVCNAVRPDLDLTGRVAIIDRGECLFRDKTLNAQAAGAIAAIICNFEDPAQGMTAPIDGTPEPTIPTVSLGVTDCNVIKSVIANGGEVSLSIGLVENTDADFFDGDMDNGIIAHEIAHGISNRLVGGPSNTNCLRNSEQMGEGWSDFYTLVTAQKPGQDGTENRGIGTYVLREPVNGRGIRSFAYNTDLSANPENFDDVRLVAVDANNLPIPHQIGSIWNAMLWDLYWALVDEYGFSPDLINGEAGNNIAVRLVQEGFKMTACNPGFVDGRDGILAADEFLFDGANSCIIWSSFARRGLGPNADQGDTNDWQDGVSDFEAPRECVLELKITKDIVAEPGEERFADVVDPGASVDIIMTVTNDKGEDATNVTLTESIAPGTTASNISGGGEVVGDNIVWAIGDMQPLDVFEATYTINTDPTAQSRTRFFDDIESGGNLWIPLTDSQDNADLTANQWAVGSNNADLGTFSGNSAYFISDLGVETRENLFLNEEIQVTGDNPGLRFYHNYDTEASSDGVLVQVSTDAIIWEEIPSDQFIKGAYPSPIQFATFTLPFLEAYTGSSEGYTDVWIDLSAYQGQTIFVRLRFGSDDNTEGVGYAMDNFEYLDIERFNTAATLSSDDEEDLTILELPEGGIKINSTGVVAVDDVNNPSLGFNIYPNPASETVNLSINNITAKDAQLSVFNYSGQLIEERRINLSAGAQTEQVNVSSYPTGFYFFRLTTERGVATEKIMVGN